MSELYIFQDSIHKFCQGGGQGVIGLIRKKGGAVDIVLGNFMFTVFKMMVRGWEVMPFPVIL